MAEKVTSAKDMKYSGITRAAAEWRTCGPRGRQSARGRHGTQGVGQSSGRAEREGSRGAETDSSSSSGGGSSKEAGTYDIDDDGAEVAKAHRPHRPQDPGQPDHTEEPAACWAVSPVIQLSRKEE